MPSRDGKGDMSSTSVSLRGASELRRLWGQRAAVEIWSGPPDGWWTPAVDAVSEAFAAGRPDIRAPCTSLGAQRAELGVFVDEARADIVIAAELAGLGAATSVATDSVTIGWVDRYLDLTLATPCLDPLTELAPLAYLTTRIDEISAEARFIGRDPAASATLVIVRIWPVPDPIERETHMITIQVALRNAFRAGETLARLRPNVAAALVRTGSGDLPRSLATLRHALDVAVSERRLPAASAWLEPMPADRRAFGRWVSEID